MHKPIHIYIYAVDVNTSRAPGEGAHGIIFHDYVILSPVKSQSMAHSRQQHFPPDHSKNHPSLFFSTMKTLHNRH
jgi:hypothetical protein